MDWLNLTQRNTRQKLLALLLVLVFLLEAAAPAAFAGSDSSLQSGEGREVVVNTDTELKEALADSSVGMIYFGSDIAVSRTDLVIEPNRQSNELVIDGNGHTLTEYFVSTYSTSKGIRIAKKGSIDTITLQNMDIVGQNGYGTIYVPSAVPNLTQKYINLTYKGPQITHNIKGSAYYEDVDITLDFAQGGKYTGEVAETTHVTLAGTVNIVKEMDTDGVADEMFWIEGGKGSITIEPGAVVNAVNNSHGQSTPSGFVYGSYTYTFDIGEGAVFNYSGWEQFTECLGASAITVGKKASVDISIKSDAKKGFVARPAFLVDGSLTVDPKGTFRMRTDGDLKYAALRVNGDLTAKPGSNFYLISENNSTKTPAAPILVMEGTADFQDPADLLIYNSNDGTHDYARAIGWHKAGMLKVSAEEVYYWKNAARSGGPSVLENPDLSWVSTSGSFTAEGKVKAGANGVFDSFTASGYAGSDLTKDTFSTKGVKVISVRSKAGVGVLDIEVEGERKENRKLTVYGAATTGSGEDYEDLTAGSMVSMEIVPVDETIARDVIKIDDESALADWKELIIKQAGDYELRLILDKGGNQTVYTRTITIQEDEAPAADFTAEESYYRNADGEAHILFNDESYSPDSDAIGRRQWTIVHDSDNDGSFAGHEPVVIDGDEQDFLNYIADEVGFYQASLTVWETFDNTIPKFITEDDFRQGTSEPQIFEVKNKAPSVDGSIEKEKHLDLVVTFGDIAEDRAQAFTSALEDVKEILESKGAVVRLGGVGSNLYTAVDTFDWDIYEHTDYRGREHSITIDDKDIRMDGYRIEAYKDFLFMEDQFSGEKTFTFDLIRDRTDWHSMEGGGFLFNTVIEDGTIEGYCVLVTQSGLKLVQINRVNLNSFRNGSYNMVQNAGKLLTTASIGDPYAAHTLKIVVSPTEVSVWDNDKLVIDGYKLPDEKKSYGFGPIISHISHNCSQLSYFTFSNILMETSQSLTLAEALHLYDWKNSGTRALVHISDDLIDDFIEAEETAKTAETILRKDLFLAGVGNGSNEEQYTYLLQNLLNGLYLSGDDTSAFTAGLADALWIKIKEQADYNPDVFTIDDGIAYPYDFSDPEGDAMLSELFLYRHNPDVFSINTGIVDRSGIYGSRLSVFPKVGLYDVQMKASDAPSEIAELLEAYHLWSDEIQMGKDVLVHQRPVALFDAELSTASESRTHADLNIAEKSYDPDHTDKSGSGITAWEWKWKDLSDDEWTEGMPPEALPFEAEYMIYLRVVDEEGEYSYPHAVYISTMGMTPFIDDEPPVISLSAEKTVWTLGDQVRFEASATDNDEVALFEVYIDGVLHSTEYGRQLFTAEKTGDILIEVIAKDFAGNEARESMILTIVAPDREAPDIELHEPQLSAIFEKTDIVASITDASGVASYMLEYRLEETDEYILISSGTGAVDRQVLGTIDPEELPEGNHEYRITAEDTVGNRAWLTFTIRIQKTPVDTEAPIVEILSPANNELVKGTIDIRGTVWDETALAFYELRLVRPDYDPVILASGDTAIRNGIIHTWDTTQVQDATWRLELYGEDAAGNWALQRIGVHVKNTEDDYQPPVVEFHTPVHQDTLKDQVPVVVSATDNREVTEYELALRSYEEEDFTVLVSGSGTLIEEEIYLWDTTELEDGIYALRLSAADARGNRVSLTVFVIVHNSSDPIGDGKAPETAITSPEHGSIVNGTVDIIGTARDETELEEYWLEYREDGSDTYYPITSGSSPVEDGLLGTWDTKEAADGIYEMKLTAKDRSGNIGWSSIYVRVRNTQGPRDDTTPPEALIETPEDGSSVSGIIVITGTAADETQLSSYALEYRKDGSESWQMIHRGIWEVVSGELAEWNTANVSEGLYEIRLTVYDAADNESQDVISVYVEKGSGEDTVPPITVISSPENNAVVSGAVTVRGTAMDDIELDHYMLQYRRLGSEEYKTITGGTRPVQNGALGVFRTSTLAEGTYELRLLAQDAAGNTNEYAINVYVKDSSGSEGPDKTDFEKPVVDLELEYDLINYGDWIRIFATASDNTAVTDLSLWINGIRYDSADIDRLLGGEEIEVVIPIENEEQDIDNTDDSSAENESEEGTEEDPDQDRDLDDDKKLTEDEDIEKDEEPSVVEENAPEENLTAVLSAIVETIDAVLSDETESEGVLQAAAEISERDEDEYAVTGVLSVLMDDNEELVITYKPTYAGRHDIRAVATDRDGNIGEAAAVLRVLDTFQSSELIVDFDKQDRFVTISTPTEITGTISGEGFSDYELLIAPAGTTDYRVLATSSTPVENGVLGIVDTTMLQNGAYDVMFNVYSKAGAWGNFRFKYQIDGNLKLGDFSFTFTDMTLAITSLPFMVDRIYDSRRREISGDFGYGWELATGNVELIKGNSLGTGWEQRTTGGLLPVYSIWETSNHDITIRYPDGTSDLFSVVPSPRQRDYAPIDDIKLTFQPKPGTTSKLEMIDPDYYLMSGRVGGFYLYTLSGYEFDCNHFLLTTKEGIKYRFRNGSMYQIEDLNGNTITRDSSGFHHSDGKSILFERDSKGRITKLQEGDNYLLYAYDDYGDLVTVTDTVGREVNFIYDSDHLLTDVYDPLGVRATKNEYDEQGRLTASIDADGNRIEFDHDVAARTSVVRDQRGYQTVYGYDDDGNVLSITDARGYAQTFKYDSVGNKIEHTDQMGNTTKYEYNSRRDVTKVIAPDGAEITSSYNSEGRLAGMKDIEADLLSITYDDNGNMSSMTDGEGNAINYAYDTVGRLTNAADAIGTLWSFTYDGDGNVKTKTDGEGNTAAYTYDKNGWVLSKTLYQTKNGRTENLTEFYTYDSIGNIIEVKNAAGDIRRAEYDDLSRIVNLTDALGRQTRFIYDRLGRISDILYADGTSEQFSYDAAGNMVKAVDRMGWHTVYEHDSVNQLTKAVFANGAEVRYEYDGAGKVTGITNPLSGVTQYEYDSAGRNTAVVDPLGNRTEYIYNARGQLDAMRDPLGNETRFSYDGNGSRTEVLLADGTGMKAEYDERGRIVRETDQEGKETTYTYNKADALTSVTNAAGGTYSYTYDERCNVTSVTDANGHVTRYGYDSESRLVQITRPMGMSASYTYDGAGQLVSYTDFNGRQQQYTYDDMGRVMERQTAGQTYRYTYTNSGLLESVTGNGGTTSYEYNEMNGLVKKVNPDGSGVSYTYDPAGNFTSITGFLADGTESRTEYEYDTAQRLTRVIARDGTAFVFEYDANGNRSAMRYGGGTVITYEYDALNRLTKETVVLPSGGTHEYVYTLSPSGQRTKVAEEGRETSYAYDDLYRLVREEIVISDQNIQAAVLDEVRQAYGSDSRLVTEYTYDGVGNRLTKAENGRVTTYTYDANDRMLTAGSESFTYDDNGNLIRQQSGTRTTVYEYDSDDRLVKVKIEDGADLTIETYGYDPLGNRISKTLNEVETTRYVVDDNGLAMTLLEVNGDGSLAAEYVHGFDILSMTRSGGTRFYVADGQENVRLLLDADGSVSDSYGYDAFGNLIYSTGTTDNSYLYRGEYQDVNTGFYYLRARYMDPASGRFLTTDPWSGSIYDPQSLHRYTYANSNPITYSDPTGMFSLMDTQAGTTIRGYLSQIVSSSAWKLLRDVMAKGAKVAAEWAAKNKEYLFKLLEIGTTVGPPLYNLAKNIPFADIINPDIIGAILAAASGEPALAGYLLDQGIREIKYELTQCFTAGTLVETDQGPVPIEEIEEGDYVLSLNFETGELEYNTVTSVYIGETDELYLITAGGDVIEATYGHPFYVEEEGWVEAGELQAGDTLVMSGSSTVQVASVEVVYLEEPVLVYNIEVKGTHNYFVGGGVLVHNGCRIETVEDIIKNRIPQEYKGYSDIQSNCELFADKLIEELTKEGIEYKIILATSSQLVYSDAAGQQVGVNYHYAVQVGDNIYDNMPFTHGSGGVSAEQWKRDLGHGIGFEVNVEPVEKIIKGGPKLK